MMESEQIQKALSAFFITCRLFGVLPYFDNNGYLSKVYKVYSLLLISTISFLGCSKITSILLKFSNAIEIKNSDSGTMAFVQIFMLIFMAISSFPMVHLVMKKGEKLGYILQCIKKICSYLNCTKNFYITIKNYVLLYLFAVFPLLIANIVKECILWEFLLGDVMDFSMYNLKGGMTIRFLQFVVECEMMVFVLIVKLLTRILNCQVLVSNF